MRAFTSTEAPTPRKLRARCSPRLLVRGGRRRTRGGRCLGGLRILRLGRFCGRGRSGGALLIGQDFAPALLDRVVPGRDHRQLLLLLPEEDRLAREFLLDADGLALELDRNRLGRGTLLARARDLPPA